MEEQRNESNLQSSSGVLSPTKEVFTESMTGQEPQIPHVFYCPVTLEVMVDPVLDREGNSFERKAIVQWLKKEKVSPISKEPLSEASLVPNIALCEVIHHFMGEEWSAKQREYTAKREKWVFPKEGRGSPDEGRNRMNKFLQDLSVTTGKKFCLNNSGVCAFSCNGVSVVIEVPQSSSTFLIYSPHSVHKLSAEQTDRILELNYLQLETRGGSLGVRKMAEGNQEVVYSFSGGVFEITSKDFRATLDTFIDTALKLEAEIFDPSGSTTGVPQSTQEIEK